MLLCVAFFYWLTIMLYICATPIGNLKDISLRALELLNSCDIILCEDTRNSQKLFNHHQIKYQKLVAFHEHNEQEISHKVIEWLNAGMNIVQITDAGTPGVSDPGARLCNLVRKYNLPVSPIPGACAYITLLSVSGINAPSVFYGFLPHKSSHRKNKLIELSKLSMVICIYESPHRIVDSLLDIRDVFGTDTNIVMGRELTKQFETIKHMPIDELIDFITNDINQQKGEFVLLIIPSIKEVTTSTISPQQLELLNLLLAELPPKKAASITAKFLSGDKNLLYTYAIGLRNIVR